MRRMAAIPLVLGLVGCVASLSYREPDSGPRARVRFVTSTDMVTTVWRYADEACSGGEQEMMRLRNGSLLNATPKRLGMPLWTYHDNAAQEVYLPSATTFHGLVSAATWEGWKCAIPFSIDVRDGKDYELYFDFAQCRLIASEIVASPAGYRKAAMPHVAKDVESCRAAIQRRRLY